MRVIMIVNTTELGFIALEIIHNDGVHHKKPHSM